MRIAEILAEARVPLRVLDLRYEEPDDPTLVLKHWGSHPKSYIRPSDGVFWHWKEGQLILHSERNDFYSWKMVQLLRMHASGGKVRPVEAWLKTPAGKEKQPFEMWNQLNGKVDLANRLITVHKEHPQKGAERQRAINNIKELQDLLRALAPYGVTADFKITGVPGHIAKTVAGVMSQDDPTTGVLTGKPPVMYHGTSMSRWQQIRLNGLRPGHTGKAYVDLIPGYSENNVYLATNAKTAEFYAKRQSAKDGDDKGVILRVMVPDPARLMSDDEWLPRGQWSDVEKRLLPNDPKALLQRAGSKTIMKLSGRTMGSFAYRGNILPNNIELLRTVSVRPKES